MFRLDTDKGKFRAALATAVGEQHAKQMVIFNDVHGGSPTRRLKVWLHDEADTEQLTAVRTAAQEQFGRRFIELVRSPGGRQMYLYLTDGDHDGARYCVFTEWKRRSHRSSRFALSTLMITRIKRI